MLTGTCLQVERKDSESRFAPMSLTVPSVYLYSYLSILICNKPNDSL